MEGRTEARFLPSRQVVNEKGTAAPAVRLLSVRTHGFCQQERVAEGEARDGRSGR